MKPSSYFSEEKIVTIEKYVQLLKKYQMRFNLVGKSTISNIWTRHIIDSAQIYNLLPKEKKNSLLIDVGTGAGFPGIILAIMGRKDVCLCEKSNKKAAFLKEVIEICNINTFLINRRVEDIKNRNYDVIVSRAFSPLKKLVKSTMHLISKDTVLVLHKGKKHKEEIEEAKKFFSFTFDLYNSITNQEARILRVKNIRKEASG